MGPNTRCRKQDMCSAVLLEPDTMRGIKFLVEILCISLSLGLLFYQYRDQYLSADFTADSWEAEQFKRQARVQNVCSNHGLASPAKIPHQRGWLVASEQHFFMCRNHKVGTSTYIGTTFQQIADIRKFDRGLLKDMFLGTPKNMKGIQDKNSVSIAVVRHPYERLVSAYEDKAIKDKAIKWDHLKGLSFEEFLTSVVIKQAECMAEGCMNVHWLPFYATCPFCSHNFTVISKMETFAEDQEKLHEMLNLPFKAQSKNVRKSTELSTKDLAKLYFEDIPVEVKRKLENIYELDFELFDYSHQL